MTFEEILAQVLTVLQREKRVSYRALQRRLALDDDDLEALKDELIYAKKLAVDEENHVLVWTGNIEGTTDTASPPDTTSQQPPQMGYVRDGCKKVSQAISGLKTIGCNIALS